MEYQFNNEIIKKMWQDRYQKNGETVSDNLHRVADYCGTNDKEKKDFFNIMNNGLFFPAGRTMSNAGIGKHLTMNNCFVCYQIPNNMEGIFDCVKLGALTHKAGGGIGYDFSLLSPKGTPTHNDAIASGVVSFMDVFDAETDTIQQGNRRGANMGVLNIYHPDIYDFINAKATDKTKLTHFNLSVMVDDDFMNAMLNDEKVNLHYPVYDNEGKILKDSSKWEQHKEVSAKQLWDLIMTNAYNNGEPGVFQYDNLNKDNNLYYIENIVSSNPCFTGDMELLTLEGYKTFEELNGRDDISVMGSNGTISPNNKVWCNGEKEVVEVKFTNGMSIKCTPEHIFMLNNGEKCMAKNLKGNRCMPYIPQNNINYIDRYIKYGFIQGDGQTTRLSSKYHQGIEVNIGENDKDIAELFSNENFTISSNTTIYLNNYKNDLIDLGFSDQKLPNRPLPTTFDEWSYIQKLSFLRGLFSANGCVVKHNRVQFKTTCNELALQIQSTLKDFEINSIITTNKSKKVEFNNGIYNCKQSYDIAINQYESILKFNELIGFIHKYKNEELIKLIKEHSPYVASVKSLDNQKVYDFTENTTHWGIVNGCVVHNCSEYLAGTIYGKDLNPQEFGGACNLGSLFLHNFVINPFTNDARFDFTNLHNTIKTAVRFLDNIIDINTFPDKVYENYQKNFRTIGLGVTGLADALAMLKIKYDSQEALDMVDNIMEFIAIHTYKESIELAKEKGSFPLLDKDKFIQSGYIQKHIHDGKTYEWVEIIKDIQKYGIRNAKMLSVAPVGTLSLTFGNNCSSGIEPIFALSYDRKIMIGGQNEENETIVPMVDYAYNLAKSMPQTIDDEWFPTALNISVDDHIKMLGTIAKHIDMSVSKTINVPTECSFDEAKDIYIKCWRLGIKGCTIFRPNKIRQGILLTNNGSDNKETLPTTLPRGYIVDASDDLIAMKRSIRSGCGKFYIHVDFDEITGSPQETFIELGSCGGCERNLQFISRLISLALRSGVPIEAIIDQARSIKPCKAYCDRTKKYGDTSKGTSCPSAIGWALGELDDKIQERCFADFDNDEICQVEDNDDICQVEEDTTNTNKCPECGADLRYEGGCMVCGDCGWSKCD